MRANNNGTAHQDNAANAGEPNGKGTEFSRHGQDVWKAPWGDVIDISPECDTQMGDTGLHGHGVEDISAATPPLSSDVVPDVSDNLVFDDTLIDNPKTPPEDVSELPTWLFPPELRNVADEVANGYQCSRDFVVAGMMSAASTVLGNHATSRFVNYDNMATLWIALVGDCASNKTNPLTLIFEPVEAMENEAYTKHERDLQQWNDNGNKGAKPQYRHRLINNASDESVLNELSVNDGNICWKTDELRTMFESFGKYSKSSGTIVGNLLSIFNNVPINITRVTSEPRYIKKPNLNIIGGIQPEVLKRIMRNNGFVDDGLFQRFLFVFPEQTDTPPFADIVISNESRIVWSNAIKRLATIGDITLQETAEARLLHIDAINRWRMECNTTYRGLEPMRVLVRKLEAHLCRWSIVAAILSGNRQITSEVIEFSVESIDYFKKCGEKAYCEVSHDADKARATSPTKPTKGEVFKALVAYYPDIVKARLADVCGISKQLLNDFMK